MLRDDLKYQVEALRHRLLQRLPLRKVLVNGSPKSGTTWVLRLVASLPGYRPSPAYNFRGDIERYPELLPGEVAHGHDRWSQELEEILSSEGIRVILPVRDLRDQLVSHMMHLRRDTTLPFGLHAEAQRLDDDALLMLCIEGRPGLLSAGDLSRITLSWIEERGRKLVVRYEDLLTDPAREFRRILGHLEIPLPDSLVEAIIRRNQFERVTVGRRVWRRARRPGEEARDSHFRKGIAGDWKNFFKPEHVSRFKQVSGDVLTRLGYEDDANW